MVIPSQVNSLCLLSQIRGTKKIDRKFYVYVWYYKDTNQVFYVGKGTGNRYRERKLSRNKFFKNIVEKHKDNVDSKIIHSNLTEDEAFNLEKETIAYYKSCGQAKANFHVGGKGGNTGTYDSPERSRKLSEAAKKKVGEKNPMFGKHHSSETKKKLSEKNRGRKLTPDHIEKLKLANKGRKVSQEQRERLGNLNR